MTAVILSDCSNKQAPEFTLLKCVCDGISIPHEIEWVNVQELLVAPCKKCFKCLPYGECTLSEDDAQRVGRMIFDADALVIGLSTSLEKPSLKLNTLLERIDGYLAFQNRQGEFCPWRKGRSVVIVSHDGLDEITIKHPDKIIPERSSLLQVLSKGGFKLAGVVSAHPDVVPSLELLPLEKARSLGKNLSRCN